MKLKLLVLFSSLLFFFLEGCKDKPCNCEELKSPRFTQDIQGAKNILLKGEDAGLSLDKLPGVKSITYEEWHKLEKIPETGLYLVNTDFVPQELPENLKKAGYTLHRDGTLDSAGVKITLFVQSQVYKIENDVPSKGNNKLESDSVSPRAFPQPWAAYSYSFWWKYDGGFCRGYNATTSAYAYGPRTGDFWPSTNIQWMQTNARLSSGGNDTDVCSNCFSLSSSASWDIGCFWPAHGGTSGSHYMYMYDSGASAYVNWAW